RDSAGIADAEPFSCHSADICLTAGCSVERHISDDDIFFRTVAAVLRRIYHKFSSGKTLAEVIVGISFQAERQSLGNKRAETLAAASFTFDDVGVRCKGILEFFRDFR